MLKICIKDLIECELLDRESMNRLQGGNLLCGTAPYPTPNPGSIEGIMAKYMEWIPELPMQYETNGPSVQDLSV